jgi:tyrosine decarboxylase/aspartate 1-decarboxylase
LIPQPQFWKKLSPEELNARVFDALDKNIDYRDEQILGVPGSFLDPKVFSQDAPFLREAPFLSTLIHNPNHIGCHTLGESEYFFAGTQGLEQELIRLCAEDIFHGASGQQDGYVASGGTEANIQALWIYRNFFVREKGLTADQIAILGASDLHYSIDKGADLLGLQLVKVPVDSETRQMTFPALIEQLEALKAEGVKAVCAVASMMTTMFGSVDDIDILVKALKASGLEYRIHIDGAYGGFFFPFSVPEHRLHFGNPHVDSISVDAHKMVQAPYGTGIFLARKGLMRYALTPARYVQGEDMTLVGSRSGANAVAIWMILMTYGPYGWKEKILTLLHRTDWLCAQLDELKLNYFRSKGSNIVTLKGTDRVAAVAETFGLVPDNHHDPSWFKVVVMEHVTVEKIIPFLEALGA